MLFCSDEEAERNLEEQRERYTPFITELQYTGIQVKTTLDTFKFYYLVAEVPGVARGIIKKSNFYFWKKIEFLFAYITPRVLMGSLKKILPFGPANIIHP